MMVGWGRLATHNSTAALSTTSIRSPETYSSIPPSEGYIMKMSAIGSLSRTIEHQWLYLNHSAPLTTIGPTVIHWLMVNGVTDGRPECDHNGPTINIWWTVSRGEGAYFTHPDPPYQTPPPPSSPPRPFVRTFILLRTGNSRLRREIVFG